MDQDRRQLLIDTIHDYTGKASETMSDAELEREYQDLQRRFAELR